MNEPPPTIPLFAASLIASLALGLSVGATGRWFGPVAAVGLVVLIGVRLVWRGLPADLSAIGAGAMAGGLLAAGVAHRLVETDPLAEQIGGQRIRGVLQGRVVDGPEPLEGGWGFEVAVDSLDDRSFGPERPRVRAFLPDRDREQADGRLPLPGDLIEAFVRLERYPSRAFPRRPGARRRMKLRGIAARALVEDAITYRGRAATLSTVLHRRLSRWRLNYVASIRRRLPDRRAAYVLAMTAGTRGLLTDRQYAPFRRSGAAHLLAISGLHLGVLGLLLWGIFGALVGRIPLLLRRWGRRRVCGPAVLASLTVYVLAIGAPVSAVRALLMVGLVVLARLTLRPTASLYVLSAAAIGAAVIAPEEVVGLGFQLSFAATFAILWFLERRPLMLEPPLAATLAPGADPEPEPTHRRLLRRAGTTAGVSLSATLATWPVLLCWNGAVPLDGLWVNLVVTPAVSALLVPLIFGGAALSAVWPAGGAFLLDGGGRAMEGLASLLRTVARVPPWELVTGALPVWSAIGAGLGLVLVVGSGLRRRPLAVGGVMAAAFLTLGSWLGPFETGDGLEVHAIPVGQGDATLLRLPDDRTVLVDGGGRRMGSDPGRRIVVPYLHRLGIARLDAVVATHADFDHVGGLVAVARRMRPRRFIYDGADPTPRLGEVVEAMALHGARMIPVGDGVRRRFGPAALRVLPPLVGSDHSANDASLVTGVRYAGRRVLLPGDIERAGERRLVEEHLAEADLLKVPHHGSKTSSSPGFLQAADPAIAVVSAGRFNAFGHPAPRVRRRYRRRRIPLWWTARSGLIVVSIARDGRMTARAMRR